MGKRNIALNKSYFSSNEHQDYKADKAFDGNTSSDNGWRTGVIGTQYVVVDLGGKHIIREVAMWQMEYNGDARAKDFNVYGSNDSEHYTLIYSGILENKMGERQIFSFDNSNSFQFYKFEFTSHYGASRSVGISEIEIYVSYKTLILTKNEYRKYDENGWQSVSSTPPTKSQFESDGMDDLAKLDRTVQLSGSQTISQSEVLGEGKIFKGTVDLKKYMDLRNISVK